MDKWQDIYVNITGIVKTDNLILKYAELKTVCDYVGKGNLILLCEEKGKLISVGNKIIADFYFTGRLGAFEFDGNVIDVGLIDRYGNLYISFANIMCDGRLNAQINRAETIEILIDVNQLLDDAGVKIDSGVERFLDKNIQYVLINGYELDKGIVTEVKRHINEGITVCVLGSGVDINNLNRAISSEKIRTFVDLDYYSICAIKGKAQSVIGI